MTLYIIPSARSFRTFSPTFFLSALKLVHLEKPKKRKHVTPADFDLSEPVPSIEFILLATEKAVIQKIAPPEPECVKVEGGSGLFDVDKFVCSTRPYAKLRTKQNSEPNNNTRERAPMLVIS